MRGEVIGVWSEAWSEIWLPLSEQDKVPRDIFCELYRSLAESSLRIKPSIEILADLIDDPDQSRDAFEKLKSEDVTGEHALILFLEDVFSITNDLGGDKLSDQYIFLLSNFIEKYSLRYDLRSPCTLCPTLPGIFSSLIRELRVLTTQNEHLNMLMNDFEESIRDLRQDSSDRRIKTAIQKQVNLIEALGALCPGVTSGELGRICSEVSSWPHRAVSGSLKSLYGFASDYPGIRHAGNPKGVTRQIDMRDLVAISILLAGFTPYLCDTFDPKSIYLGS